MQQFMPFQHTQGSSLKRRDSYPRSGAVYGHEKLKMRERPLDETSPKHRAGGGRQAMKEVLRFAIIIFQQPFQFIFCLLTALLKIKSKAGN